ncbi:MAG: alpha/beta hydrolase [Deltaproteobacteria bacterium]|nr:alpha/beta hydrolase [Deltaproteobacteria bacterium]
MYFKILLLSIFIAGCDSSGSKTVDDASTDFLDGNNNQLNYCSSEDWPDDKAAAYNRIIDCLESDYDVESKKAAIGIFIGEIKRLGGFPIISGNNVIFIYVNDPIFDQDDDSNPDEDYSLISRLPPINVSGDFNSWILSEQMQYLEPDFYHLKKDFSGTDIMGSSYKFISRNSSGSEVWFSDPLSERYLFDEYGRLSLIMGDTQTGHLRTLNSVYSPDLDNSRDIFVYVPPGYDQNTDTEYPVIYMHDGNNLFDTAQINSNGSWDADGVADLEISSGNTQPFIIVGIPNNENRMDEYTHTEDSIDGGANFIGGDSTLYAAYIVNNVKPLIDEEFRTKSTRENTAVCGSSLGGLVSYHAGLIYPNIFRYVCGMSSTFGWGEFSGDGISMEDLYRQNDIYSLDQIYYLDSGDNPSNPENPPSCPNETEAEDNYCETMSFRDMLIEKGIVIFPDNPDSWPLTPEGVNIYHYYVPDAPHNESAWNSRLYRAFRFFFGQ